MPDTPYPENGDPSTALLETQQLLTIQGFYHVDGLDASLTSGLDLSLTSGTTAHGGGGQTQHDSQTVALPDSDPADPRWDLVVATPSGLQAIDGEPDSVSNYPNDPSLQLRYGQADRMATPIPTLPDLSSVYEGSGERPVALWAVWRPAGADSRSDLVDSEQHLFDRRIERSATMDQAGSLVSSNDYTVNSLQATQEINTERLSISRAAGSTWELRQFTSASESAMNLNIDGSGGTEFTFDAPDSDPASASFEVGGGDGTISAGGMRGPQIQERNELSGDRSLDTTYQNTTGYSLFVRVQVACAAGDDLSAFLAVGTTSGGADRGEANVDGVAASAPDAEVVKIMSGTVPPDDWYRARTFGQGTIDRWAEREWRD